MVPPKGEKCCFLDVAPPTLQNSGIFHDSTRPHLHFDGLPPKSRRSVVCIYKNYGALQVLQKNIDVLVWAGAAHAPIAVEVGPQVNSVQQQVCAKFYLKRWFHVQLLHAIILSPIDRQALKIIACNKVVSCAIVACNQFRIWAGLAVSHCVHHNV